MDAGLGEVLDFLRMLWAVDHCLNITSKRMETSLGVTGMQRFVLRLVGQNPGITASRLSRILHVHPSTLTGVVKRLEARGYIERHEDRLDNRRAFIHLTQAGRALNVPDPSSVEAAIQRMLSRLPEEQLGAAQELLSALAEELHPREGAPGPEEPRVPEAASPPHKESE